jgi:hypothetical protein
VESIDHAMHKVADIAWGAYRAKGGTGHSIFDIDMALEKGEIYDPRTGKIIDFHEERDRALNDLCADILRLVSMLRSERQLAYQRVLVGGGGAKLVMERMQAVPDYAEQTFNWQPVSNYRRAVVEGALKALLMARRAVKMQSGR